MEEYFEASRWLSAIRLLSLDFVRQFYEHLGVGVPFEETLRGLLRDALLGRYQARSVPLTAGSPVQVVTAHKENVIPALNALAVAFGEGQRDRLQYWVHYRFASDDNPWELYHDFLSRWAKEMRRDGQDTIGFSSGATAIAYELRTVTTIDDIKDLLEAARAKPLSDWDRRLFEQRGLLNISPGSDYFPFMDEICLAVQMKRFQAYFDQLVSTLNMRDRQAIEAAVRCVGADQRAFAGYFRRVASDLNDRGQEAIEALVDSVSDSQNRFVEIANLPR